MIKYLFFSLVTIVLFTAVNCKKDPPVVPPVEKPPSHPTITWTADTIHNPYGNYQLILSSIWGSDINDVYAVGHNEYGGRASMFHFDGTQWNVVKITKGEGGFIGSSIDLLRIDGSGKNDVWAVGSRGSYNFSNVDSSLVIHYDGTTWKEVLMDRCKFSIQGLKVVSPNDVYLGGSYGEVYHYDGVTFTKSVLDTNLIMNLGGDEQRMFIGGILWGKLNAYTSIYSKEKNSNWKLITSTTESEYYQKHFYGRNDFYPVGDGRYFTGGEGIYTIVDTVWTEVYNDMRYSFYLIRGTSSTNIFALSSNQRLAHWNGIDWKPVNMPERLNNYATYGLWVHGKSIFINHAYSYDTNIIYRGRYE